MNKEDLNKLIVLYPDSSNKELALMLGFSVSWIQQIACRLKLRKSALFMKICSVRYRKGHIPASKGIKGVHNSPATEFKPGIIPANTEPVGSIKIRNNFKRDNKYYHIKLPDGTWQELHRYKWMKKYGPIPKDKILVFKDRDTMNVEIDNFETITRTENAERNRNGELASVSLKETWNREKLRVLYDLPQQTKFRISKAASYKRSR